MRNGKEVTEVTNVEKFGLDVEEVSRELRKQMAASVAVTQVGPSKVLIIQGTDAARAAALLVAKFGVPKRLVVAPEPKKKKGGR